MLTNSFLEHPVRTQTCKRLIRFHLKCGSIKSRSESQAIEFDFRMCPCMGAVHLQVGILLETKHEGSPEKDQQLRIYISTAGNGVRAWKYVRRHAMGVSHIVFYCHIEKNCKNRQGI